MSLRKMIHSLYTTNGILTRNADFFLEHIHILCWGRQHEFVSSNYSHATIKSKWDSNKAQIGTPTVFGFPLKWSWDQCQSVLPVCYLQCGCLLLGKTNQEKREVYFLKGRRPNNVKKLEVSGPSSLTRELHIMELQGVSQWKNLSGEAWDSQPPGFLIKRWC